MTTPHKTHNPGFLDLVNDANSRIQQVNVKQYLEMRETPHILIDVREDHEWAAGHAGDAIHLSKGTIERDIEERVADKAAKLVLYCGGGFRSALAADALRRMGYSNAISLEGGWRAWNEAGLAVVNT